MPIRARLHSPTYKGTSTVHTIYTQVNITHFATTHNPHVLPFLKENEIMLTVPDYGNPGMRWHRGTI